MKPGIVDELRGKVVKNFLDIFILTQLEKSPVGGYDIIANIHKKFDIMISSGTVYSTLYGLERDGLIKGDYDERRRIYFITNKGRQDLERVKKANGEIRNLLSHVLPLNAA